MIELRILLFSRAISVMYENTAYFYETTIAFYRAHSLMRCMKSGKMPKKEVKNSCSKIQMIFQNLLSVKKMSAKVNQNCG